jgi:NADPH:quinone reductase-like Zn-dependent oxidoreductase
MGRSGSLRRSVLDQVCLEFVPAHVLALGAETVIDYHAEKFEERVRDVDLVLDLVGGDVPARSWAVLVPAGALVSTVVPDVAAHAPEGRRGVFLMMHPDADALAEMAKARSLAPQYRPEFLFA